MASGRHYSQNDEVRRLLKYLKVRVTAVEINALLQLLYFSEILKKAHPSDHF
jgi:hypothetical protein